MVSNPRSFPQVLLRSWIGKTLTATIAEDSNLSNELDTEGYRFLSVYMPATWTAADLGIKVAPESAGTFLPLYTDEGTLVSITPAVNRVISFERFIIPIASVRFIKLWSHTDGSDEAQTAERVITVELRG